MVTREKLSLDEKLCVVQNLNKISDALPNLNGIRVHETRHENTVDVFGGAIYKNDSRGATVVAELIAIVLDLYLDTYSDQCLDLVIHLIEKCSYDVLADVLTSKHDDQNDILFSIGEPIYDKLCKEFVKNQRFCLNKKLLYIVKTIAQNHQEEISQ